MPIWRACPGCKGTGRVELTGVHARTLNLLAAQGGEWTGAALAHLAGCAATAMNNRLCTLEGLGLVISRRDGVKRLYRLVSQEEEPRC